MQENQDYLSSLQRITTIRKKRRKEESAAIPANGIGFTQTHFNIN
jgi:hypothetical protein